MAMHMAMAMAMPMPIHMPMPMSMSMCMHTQSRPRFAAPPESVASRRCRLRHARARTHERTGAGGGGGGAAGAQDTPVQWMPTAGRVVELARQFSVDEPSATPPSAERQLSPRQGQLSPNHGLARPYQHARLTNDEHARLTGTVRAVANDAYSHGQQLNGGSPPGTMAGGSPPDDQWQELAFWQETTHMPSGTFLA